MKKSLALSLCALAGAALVLSCEPVEGENVDVSGGSVTVSVSEISAPEEGLVETLVVEAPEGLEISTKVESTAKTWISVSPAEGNQFEITVARNEATKSRKAKVFFSAPACASATVVVSQAAAAHEKEFSVPTTSVSATPVQAVTRAKYTDKAGAYVDNVVSVKAGKSVTYEFE